MNSKIGKILTVAVCLVMVAAAYALAAQTNVNEHEPTISVTFENSINDSLKPAELPSNMPMLGLIGYSAFPTDDPDDGKFIGIAGGGTLAHVPVVTYIGVPANETSFTLGIFDGDQGDNWDQSVGSADQLDFALYKNPHKDGTGTVLVASWTNFDMVNDDWYTQTFSVDAGAKASSGNYFYRLVAQWNDPSTANDNNFFKVRTTGRISVIGGNEFAHMGAPMNIPWPDDYPPPPWESTGIDPPVWAGDPNPGPGNNDVDANSYDGDWKYYFYVPKTLKSIRFRDGDSDYVNDTDDPNTPPPEGVSPGEPPDGPSWYDGADVPPEIYYTVTDAAGNQYANNDPSGNVERENFTISDAADADYPVTYLLPRGLWTLRVQAMDAHNMNFLEAPHEIHTDTEPPLPVRADPAVEPNHTANVQDGIIVEYAHTVTNKADLSDSYELTAISAHGWITRIYHDTNANGILDPGEPIAYNTGELLPNAVFYLIVQVDVPSGTGGITDSLTVTATSQTEWGVQGSATDTTIVTTPIEGARGLKYDAISELEDAKTGVGMIDRKIDNIISHIQRSLNIDPMQPAQQWQEFALWLDDSHLDPQHGHMVFAQEKEAVKKIQELLGHKDIPDSVRDTCRDVIDKLVEADDILANVALEDAKAFAGTNKLVDRQIAISEQELAKALEEAANGYPDKAIDHYRKAWKHAQLATKLSDKSVANIPNSLLQSPHAAFSCSPPAYRSPNLGIQQRSVSVPSSSSQL